MEVDFESTGEPEMKRTTKYDRQALSAYAKNVAKLTQRAVRDNNPKQIAVLNAIWRYWELAIAHNKPLGIQPNRYR